MIHSGDEAAWEVFYRHQIAWMSAALVRLRMDVGRPITVLDLGCGPTMEWSAPWGVQVIGVDPVHVNRSVHQMIRGDATALPLRARSVDAVVCLYSLHHIGAGAAPMRALNVCLGEIRRVLTPGGRLLVVEVLPWWPAWIGQRLAWPLLRRLVGRRLDMFFWRWAVLRERVARVFPGAWRSEARLRVPAWAPVPIAFAWPRLRLPRWAYPFSFGLAVWGLPE